MERQNFRFSQRREADFALFGALCCFAVSSNASIPIQNSQSWNFPQNRSATIQTFFFLSASTASPNSADDNAGFCTLFAKTTDGGGLSLSHSFEVNGLGSLLLWHFSFDFLSAVENWQDEDSRSSFGKVSHRKETGGLVAMSHRHKTKLPNFAPAARGNFMRFLRNRRPGRLALSHSFEVNGWGAACFFGIFFSFLVCGWQPARRSFPILRLRQEGILSTAKENFLPFFASGKAESRNRKRGNFSF